MIGLREPVHECLERQQDPGADAARAPALCRRVLDSGRLKCSRSAAAPDGSKVGIPRGY
jgi:hypothetical protein